MAEPARVITHAEVGQVLKRSGLDPEVIDDILADLPDPVDVDQAEPIFQAHGITLTGLMDRLGGSP